MHRRHSIKMGRVVRHIAPLSHARTHNAPPVAPTEPLREPPPSADLRARCSPALDQRPLASCAAHSFTSALRLRHAIKTGEDLPLSRLFLYWVTRTMVEGQRPDSGGTCKQVSVVDALRRYGVCHESLWPYETDQAATAPSTKAFDDAGARTLIEARPLTTLRAIKLALSEGYPVPLAFTVAHSVEDGEDGRASRTWETGTFPLPADDDPEKYAEREAAVTPDGPDHGVGVHAVLAVGYDDAQRKVFVQNSWGADFGVNGFGDLSYDFFGPHQDADLQSHTQPTMAYDAWVLEGLRSAPLPERPAKFTELTAGKVWFWMLESDDPSLAWRLESLPEGVVAKGTRYEAPASGREGKRYFDYVIEQPGTYRLTFQRVPVDGGAPVDTERFDVKITAPKV